jgi:hypothetical protein
VIIVGKSIKIFLQVNKKPWVNSKKMKRIEWGWVG